ncbi:hypothetical protein D0Z07_8669 [Hyphodiscus hymeniophilus]|uniref:Rhodopsin domain-containing protein n=1 Tax=Hyphodiscus hymeniophilus TaxID=353542 RepID=A0A9P6SPL5_9HELO|nr:hypothetical protein D0Z07_8669 [Hyphodiscus hymeniophilus]
MANSSAALPPDFFDKQPVANREATIVGVLVTANALLKILLWSTTGFRLYIRFFIARAPGWDDLFVVLAALHVTLGAIATCVATKYGLGGHIYLLEPPMIRKYLICHYLLGAAYVSSTAYIKISLLFQYLRIFERGTRIYRITQLTLVVIGLWGFAFIFTNWFACFPSPAAFWNGTNKGCYASFSPNLHVAISTIEAHGGSNAAWDIIVLAIAFRLLFEKDGPVNRKGLLALLALGTVIQFPRYHLDRADATTALRYRTCLCATTPFFWPIIQEALSKIFVSYEFKVVTESRWDDTQVEELGGVHTAESHHELMRTKTPPKEMPAETQSMNKTWGSYGGSSFAEDFSEDFRTVSPASFTKQPAEKVGFVKHERED